MPNLDTGHRHASVPKITIHVLNHDVLLNIFHWYRLVNTTDVFDRGWNLEHWWYRPIQVCRTWRHLILASPTRLDLHLVCTHGKPITSMLAHSPPLPLIIYYVGRLANASGEEDDVLFALLHRERVRRIHLSAPVPNLLKALNGEYATLQRLVIRSGTGVQLPTKLVAPLLRCLTLSDVRLPASGSALLLRAEHLVTLELLEILDTPALHPAQLVAQLAHMAQLERLVLHFRTALPSRTFTQAGMDAHTTTSVSVTLPRLTLLSYRGSSTYLEHTLAYLTTPSLQTLFLDLFAQLSFSLPYLTRFILRAYFTFHAVELHFDAHTACMMLDHTTNTNNNRSTNRTNAVQLRVSCRALDWQLASLAQICSALALPRIESLTLGLHVNVNAEPHRAQWHALLRVFGCTKTLQLTGPRAGHLLRSLLPLPLDILPALKELLPERDAENGSDSVGGTKTLQLTEEIPPALLQKLLPGDGDGDDAEDAERAGLEDEEGALDAFIGEREAAGCPVRVFRDWW